MTISHVYNKVTEIIKTIEDINLYKVSSSTVRQLNQKSNTQSL